MGAGSPDFIVRPEAKWDPEAWSRFGGATVGLGALSPTASEYAVFAAVAGAGPIMIRDVLFSTDTAITVYVKSKNSNPGLPAQNITSLTSAAYSNPGWTIQAGLSSSAVGFYDLTRAFLPAGWFGSLFGALRLFLDANTSLMVLTSAVAANVSCSFHVYSTGV